MSNGSEAIFMPTMSVYDTNMMGAYINAVKGEYERSLEDYDKFVSKYGDFISPIQKDVEYWNDNTFGKIDRVYNELVANGIDPVRSREGQAIMRQAARSIPYAQLANIKQNAKDAEKYNEVVRQLKLQNKYDDDFADWQFRRTHGGISMRDWDSSMGVFGADVPSPYQSMQEATKDWYEGLQNGYLGTQNGYDYFGKSPDAVRGVIAAQAPNLTSEYWQYQKDRIRSVLGPNASEEAVNSALQSVLFDSARNVYSVQDPTTGEWSNATRKENAEYGRSREYSWNTKLDGDKSSRDYYYDMQKLGVDINDPQQVTEYQRQMRESREATNAANRQKASKYPSVTGDDSYKVTEEMHYDGVFNAIKNLGIPVTKLKIDEKGNIVPAVDENGKPIMIPAYQATQEELNYAASHRNNLFAYHTRFMDKLKRKYKNQKGSYLTDSGAKGEFVSTYGYNIRGTQVQALLKNKKIEDNGAVALSKGDLDKMQSVSSIIAMSLNSGYRYPETNRQMDIFGVQDGEKQNEAMQKYQTQNPSIAAQWVFDESDPHNAITVPVKDKNGNMHTELFLKGTAKIKEGDEIIEVEQWMPAGLTSNKAAINKGIIKATDISLNESNRSAYKDVDAEYAKLTGSQKRNNISLE